MKKVDVNLKVLVAIIALFGISLSLMAQPQPRQQRHRLMDHPGAMLKLTDEQKASFKEIHLANHKEIQPLKDEIKINKARINALIKKDNPDMKEIVSLVEANGGLMTKIQVREIESKVKVRSLLTDEQKVIFDSQFERMKKRKAFARRHMHRKTQERGRF